jgi:hypothetical protein
MNLKDEIKEVWSNYEYTISNNLYSSVFADGYVAGANSKWVQAEKIKAQIEIVEMIANEFNEKYNIVAFDRTIMGLKQQLKQLEDESKID